MRADYHLHCEFSDDSREPMEEQIKQGILIGLDEMCFTDHVDYGVKTDWDSGEELTFKASMYRLNVDYPQYVNQIIIAF